MDTTDGRAGSCLFHDVPGSLTGSARCRKLRRQAPAAAPAAEEHRRRLRASRSAPAPTLKAGRPQGLQPPPPPPGEEADRFQWGDMLLIQTDDVTIALAKRAEYEACTTLLNGCFRMMSKSADNTWAKSRRKARLKSAGCCVSAQCTHLGSRPLACACSSWDCLRTTSLNSWHAAERWHSAALHGSIYPASKSVYLQAGG